MDGDRVDDPLITGAGTPPETISTSNITYWSGPAVGTGTGTFTPGQATSADARDLSTSRVAFALTGGAGVNSASWVPALTVNVPAPAVTGAYVATITHSES